MAKKQTFGDKTKKQAVVKSMIKVVVTKKNQDAGSYAFVEKMIPVVEGQDPAQAALDSVKK